MMKTLVRPLIRPLFSSALSPESSCYAPIFSGTAFGEFHRKLIDPDADIDLEWHQIGLDPAGAAPKGVINQCLATTVNQREFMVRWINGFLTVTVKGANLLGSVQNVTPSDGAWRLLMPLAGGCQVFKNGQLVAETNLVRGNASEPTARTLVATRDNGGSLNEFGNGAIFNIRYNGQYYPLSDRLSSVQRSQPDNGNPLTLFNVSAEQWLQIPCNLRNA